MFLPGAPELESGRRFNPSSTALYGEAARNKLKIQGVRGGARHSDCVAARNNRSHRRLTGKGERNFPASAAATPGGCKTGSHGVIGLVMSWTGQRRGYHHGNLREALVEAAQALIAESGPAGFTVAEAARRAGVSPAAPYRHFRDAEGLLAEVALRGFDRLSVVLTQAWRDGKPEPIQAFETMARAYLAFARLEPAFFAAMFEARINPEAHPGLLAASERAFSVLRNAADAVTAFAPRAGRPPALMVALHVWAMAHGVASLFGRADAGRRRLPMSPEDLLEAGLLIYLQSLGLAGGT